MASRMLQPPSSCSNPFSTCWVSASKLPYLDADDIGAGLSLKLIAQKLMRSPRSQIVGRHGSGKTALLLALGRHLSQEGRQVAYLRLTRRSDLDTVLGDLNQPEVLLLDGAEQIPRIRRWRLLRVAEFSSTRIVLASHNAWCALPLRLPVLARSRPSLALAERLFVHLTRSTSTPVRLSDLHRAYGRRQGDLRCVWFDLYDLHERLLRPERTSAVRVSYSRCPVAF